MLNKLRAWFITDPLIVLATVVYGTASLAASLFDSSGRTQHRIAQAWSRVLLAVARVRVRVEGLEYISPGASYVFVSNHLSLMDTPVVIGHIPAQFRFLAKKGLYKIPFIGYHLKRAGHIPVHRDDPRASLRTLSDAAQIIRERGISVLVFPEGGRSMGTLKEFKEGAAYIAIKSGVPAVPVGITGTLEILPMGSLDVQSGEALLRIGQPIPTSGLTIRDRDKLTKQLRDEILSLTGAQFPSGCGSYCD